MSYRQDPLHPEDEIFIRFIILLANPEILEPTQEMISSYRWILTAEDLS